MKRPPPISPSDPHTLYDSCVDNISSPSMYIVFERDQCYPQYLITLLQDSEDYSSASYYMNTGYRVSEYDRRRQVQAIATIATKHRLKPLTRRPSSASPNRTASYSTSQTQPTKSPMQLKASSNKKDACIIS